MSPQRGIALALGGLLIAASASAQDAGTLEIGQGAPEFALTAATRDGVQSDPVKLSDFRGQTVVIAFFYKARTKG